MSTLVFGLICAAIGAFAGVAIAYTIMEPRYAKFVAESEASCLKTVRENYAREQATRELLLREIGEALDVGDVYLPSFGWVVFEKSEADRDA